MNKQCEAERVPGGQHPRSENGTQMILRYVSSKELPNSTVIYITQSTDGYFTFFTDTHFIRKWKLDSLESSILNTYRHIREYLLDKPKSPITFIVPTTDMALALLDALPDSDRHYGRVAIALNRGEMPTPPPDPDEHLYALLAEFE